MFWGTSRYMKAGCRDKFVTSFTLWESTQWRLKIEASHHIPCTVTMQVHCASIHFGCCVSDGLFWFMKILKSDKKSFGFWGLYIQILRKPLHYMKSWIHTFVGTSLWQIRVKSDVFLVRSARYIYSAFMKFQPKHVHDQVVSFSSLAVPRLQVQTVWKTTSGYVKPLQHTSCYKCIHGWTQISSCLHIASLNHRMVNLQKFAFSEFEWRRKLPGTSLEVLIITN